MLFRLAFTVMDMRKYWRLSINQPFAPWVGVQAPFQTWQRFSKPEYIGIIEQLKQHILRGDCYEINFCQQFYGEHVKLIPLRLYEELCFTSPNPFSAYYKCVGQIPHVRQSQKGTF